MVSTLPVAEKSETNQLQELANGLGVGREAEHCSPVQDGERCAGDTVALQEAKAGTRNSVWWDRWVSGKFSQRT